MERIPDKFLEITEINIYVTKTRGFDVLSMPRGYHASEPFSYLRFNFNLCGSGGKKMNKRVRKKPRRVRAQPFDKTSLFSRLSPKDIEITKVYNLYEIGG